MKAENSGLLAVVDTNVWISGFLSKAGAPALLTRQVVRHGRPVFTLATFAELQERLWRPKFDRYLSLEHRKQLLRDVDAVAHWVTIPAEIEQQTFSRDPFDDKFIHAALKARKVIVSDLNKFWYTMRYLGARRIADLWWDETETAPEEQ